MDLFRYEPDVANIWSGGQSINGYTEATWVERYRDPGEFEIKAPVSSGLIDFLPLGCFISHTETMEIMIVENHSVDESKDDQILSITGRSLETILDQRIIGTNIIWSIPYAYGNETRFIAGNASDQIVQMIRNNIVTGYLVLAGDELPYILVDKDISSETASPLRIVKTGSVHQRALELLHSFNYGIKIIRPNNLPGSINLTDAIIRIYNGVDRTGAVIFSTQNDDVNDASYLWSLKNLKNTAIVVGQYVKTMVYGPETGYKRRVMLVDGTDIDQVYGENITDPEKAEAVTLLATRGAQALAQQKLINLVNADISENFRYRYRKDYNIGDLVSLNTNFGENLVMRVMEYAEIEEQNGSTGYPTLASPEN